MENCREVARDGKKEKVFKTEWEGLEIALLSKKITSSARKWFHAGNLNKEQTVVPGYLK